LRPFAYVQIPRENSFDQYDDDRSAQISIKLLTQGSPYHFLGIIPARIHLFGTETARLNLLGTDAYGRDLFSRILCGGQISILAGLLAASISLLLGASIGSISGYFGRWPDGVFMRLAELCLALPWLYLLFCVRAFLPLLVSPIKAFLIIVITIGALGWA